MNCKVICLETAKAARMGKPVRYQTICAEPGLVTIDLQGQFTPAAARLYAEHIVARAEVAERMEST